MTPATQARTILLDATTIATTIDAALYNLDASAGGYPATTSGAGPADAAPITECHHPECLLTNPCPLHNPTGVDTPVERLAGARDQAMADRARIGRLTRRSARDLADLALLTRQWGLGGIDMTTVKDRLADSIKSIWCVNCEQLGFDNARTNGEYCGFCSKIKSRHKRYPNERLLALHATGREATPAEVKRCFDPPKMRQDNHIPSLEEARRRRDKRIGGAA